MEFYQLEYFLEVARQRNFTLAARRLNIAQTAVSEQIKNLENELGAVLFQRGRRESVLTAAGETLQTHAQGLIQSAQAAKNAVREIVDLRGGRLSIGSIPSVSASVLPKAIKEFRQRHPLVELAIVENTSEAIAQCVQSGQVEFGLVQLPTGGTGFKEEILLNEAFVILAAWGRFPAKTKNVCLETLKQEPFILYKGRARDTALTACREAGFEPKIACESSELETIRSLVSAGLGVALLPKLATQFESDTCRVLPISGTSVVRQVAILSRAGSTLSPGAKIFREILHQQNKH